MTEMCAAEAEAPILLLLLLEKACPVIARVPVESVKSKGQMVIKSSLLFKSFNSFSIKLELYGKQCLVRCKSLYLLSLVYQCQSFHEM